jgi:hypothetical protein
VVETCEDRGDGDQNRVVGYCDCFLFHTDLNRADAFHFGKRFLNRARAAATLNLGGGKMTLNHVLNYTRKKSLAFEAREGGEKDLGREVTLSSV